MSHPKREPKRAITIRTPKSLFDKIESESEMQDWSINDEINYRLRSAMSGERVAKLESEVAELKEMIRSLINK